MSLVDVFMTPNQQRVLAAVLLNPNKSFSLTELIKASRGGHGGTQAFVSKLNEAGIISDERVGNQRRFRANTGFPIYPELRSMCVKSFGLAERLKEMLAPYKHRIDTAFVFGSVAKGTDRGSSDIDVMIVGDLDLMQITNAAADLSKELGREIQINLYSRAEWRNALNSDSIVRSIATGPKIMVIGDDSKTN